MSVEIVERRRIVLQSEDRRIDLSLPLDETLEDALILSGLSTADRFVTIGPGGFEIPGDTECEDLVDGGLYALIDRTALAPQARPAETATGPTRADHGARWWMLAVSGLLLVAVFAQGAGDPLLRLLIALLVAVGAVSGAVAWARRDSAAGVRGILGVLAPVLLSFAAGALLIPAALEASAHLSTAAGFLAAGTTTAIIAVTARARPMRAAAGTATVLLVALAAVWGLALLLRWGQAEAAAISLGLIPLGLRALPSSLVNLPEGYFIDYKHFMTSRWTVRGAIPESVGLLRPERITAVVDDSSARLIAGTAVLSVVSALMAPIAFLRPWPDDTLVIIGGIALLCCLGLALLLTPRHTTSRILRWFPRAAAAVVFLVAGIHAATALGAGFQVLGAAVLFAVGLVAVAIVIPVSRGARSLIWSRFGDAFEWLAVALALPSALLYANALSLLRGMMAG
ncbi:hypothetical protein RN51_02466 [Microbacterium oxydans]|uniref:Type VII secretion integral membrane protein EccD n=1 Tax=Microbacterium oxydans TaxID=82380 RepID=A0A0F0KMS2_9MICO|nr:hypothetical protein [Microbacterium oxydans]KJL21445.1 hypothetical protein RN51_02466 [Microbacterium oxydans]